VLADAVGEIVRMTSEPDPYEEDEDRAEQADGGYAVAVGADPERVVTTSTR
jgi:hypothetical protein